MISTGKTIAFILVMISIASGAYYGLVVNGNIGNQLVTNQNSQNAGNLALLIQDSPAPEVNGVYISFSNVVLYEVFGGHLNYSIGNQTVNIMQFTNHNSSILQNLSLMPDQYQGIGLIVTSAVVNENGVNRTFSLASREALVSHTFSVVKNRTTDINFDFNLQGDLNLSSGVFTPNVGTSFTTGTPDSHINGTMAFHVYDAPMAGVSAVYLTFSNISLHGVQTGWTNYSVSNRTMDILNLTQANASLLDSLTLGVQNYTMIRLFLKNVTVTVDGVNETFRSAAPFAFVNQPFNVSANGTTNVEIQFNLAKDLNMHARMLTPKIGTVITS